MRADAMEVANAPRMHQLIEEGTYDSNAQSEDLTFSGPNWSSILHGVHRDKHGVTSNGYVPNNLQNWPDFFTRLESYQPSWVTYRVLTWDAAHNNQPSGADFKILRNYTQNGDELATQDAEKILRGNHAQYTANPDVMFFFYSDVDVVGHQYGFDPSVPQYLAEIADTDLKIGRLLNAIQNRPTYNTEDWLVVVTTDHGGNIDKTHAGNTPERRRIPFIVSGRSARVSRLDRYARNVDVTKTVLSHMGVPINPAWGLDGHVVGLKSPVDIQPSPGLELVKNGDFEFDRGFDASLPDQYVHLWDDPGPDMATVVKYGSAGYPSATSPGPVKRGANFVAGGNQATSLLTHTVDVSARWRQVDQGVTYDVSAWLGGYSNQEDNVRLTVTFKDANGATKGTTELGPVSAAQRNNVTGLLHRSTSGTIPIGTRKVQIQLLFTRVSGSTNDGYADNVSFIAHWQ